MLGRICRALTPLLALALGSWIGLGAPRVERSAAEASGRAAVAWATAKLAPPSVEPGALLPAHLSEPPPITFALSPEIAARLPDPSPWPRLNAEGSVRKAWLLAEGPAREVNEPRRLVTLTFDDGPFPETTPHVLRLLAQHDVRATFFFLGQYLDGDSPRARLSRRVARDVLAGGHAIGNHTQDHQILTLLTRSQALAQIDDGANAIERATGVRPVFFRPPYGILDTWGEQIVRDRGLDLVLWSIEVGDMQRDDVDEMERSLREQLDFAGGGIVLLHDIRFSTIKVLSKLLTWLAQHKWDPAQPEKPGYVVVDLPEYLRETAARPQPYGARGELERARADAWRAARPKKRWARAKLDTVPELRL
jgi:peptidoglycan/xylan/chitin deacetylase (PgdA/CDA1 family)